MSRQICEAQNASSIGLPNDADSDIVWIAIIAIPALFRFLSESLSKIIDNDYNISIKAGNCSIEVNKNESMRNEYED